MTGSFLLTEEMKLVQGSQQFTYVCGRPLLLTFILIERLRPVESLYGEGQHVCDDTPTSGDQLLQNKVKVIIQRETSSVQSESETQRDRFGVQTAGHHLSWKLLLLSSNNLISSWLKWLILPGTAWRHLSRILSCVMSPSRVETGVTHPPAAGSGNQGLPQPGTESKEDGGDATGRTTRQRGRSPALQFWSGSLCSRA